MAKLRYPIYFGTLILAGASAPLFAQTSAQTTPAGAEAEATGSGIEDIVVTARRREESAQKTPISIAAVAPMKLRETNIQQPQDLDKLVAGLVTTPQSSYGGGFNAYIRGIGATESSLSVDPAVGTYRDGIYMGHSSTGGNQSLSTIERVEVLRGPQGTLFGRNTTGGAINIVTRAPKENFGVIQDLRYGRFSEIQSVTTVDTGELGKSGLSAVVSYDHRQRKGYVDDPTVSGKYDAGAFNYESIFAKAQGKWGGLTLTYVYDHFTQRSVDPGQIPTIVSPTVQAYFGNSPNLGGAAFVTSAKRLGTYDFLDFPRQKNRNRGHAVTAQYEVNDSLTLKSISSWRYFHGSGLYNSYSNQGMLGRTVQSPVVPIPVFLGAFGNVGIGKGQITHQFTQEVQALGTIGEVGYTFGAFHLAEHNTEFNNGTFFFALSPTLATISPSTSFIYTDNKSDAVYGQLSYKPGWLEGLELTGGIRYSADDKHTDQRAAIVRVGDKTFKNTTWSASASYQWTPTVMTYARVGTGVRSGGFNIRASTAGQTFLFKPEKATAYEAGIKSQFLDNHVRVNGSLFYTDYKDLQVTTYVATTTGGGVSGNTFNAAATYKGGELEVLVIPVDGLTLNANLGYVKPKYKSIFLINPATNLPQNYASTAHFPYVAKTSFNAGATYDIPVSIGTVALHADYSYVSKRWFHPSNLPNLNPFNDQIASPAHGIFNSRAAIRDIEMGGSKLEVAFWVNNVFNKFYRVSGLDFGALGFAGNTYNPPRTFGVDLRAAF
jgi:iron complex outermembrane receptor protein